MSRKAEQVVKLLEAYKNSTVNEGAQDLSVSLSASGSLRQPKRPWEEIDHDGEGDDILGPSPYGPRGKMEMGDVDEVVEVVEDSATESEDLDTASDEDDEDLPAPTISYGDTPYELVLPSSAWVEHCSMQRYYQQSFPLTAQNSDEVPQPGAALVRKVRTAR